MLGKVKSRSPRRPNVSMVHTAGQANAKLTRPKPNDPNNAFVIEAPASLRIVDE